jgi:hypothetical protein
MIDSLTFVAELKTDSTDDLEFALLGDLQLAMIGGGAGGNVALD